MTWLRRNLTTEGVVTTTDSWLVHQLTHEFVTDATTASRSLIVDVDSLTWDPELADLFGLGGESLPRIVRNDESVGSTDVFGPAVPVGGLIVDQQAALAAQRCLAPGTAKCTYGTGAFLLANTGDRAIRSTHGLTTSAAWSLRNSHAYCLDGQVYTAGSAVRWMVSVGMLSGPEALDAESGTSTGGATFAPGLAGLAAPYWVPQQCGALLGMGLSTERSHLVRAVVEGLAAQVAALVRAVDAETATPLTRLRVDGGLTRSRVLMQAQADLLQVPVDVYPCAHATALGAAAMARLALDPTLRLDAAVDAWTPEVTFEPQWPSDRAAETMAAWESSVAAVIATIDRR
jgi:glycerol kinase